MAETEGFNLCLKVGVLTSRNLILVDFSGSGLKLGFEFFVYRTNISPVFTDFLKSVRIKACISVGILQGRNDGVECRLRCKSGHGVKCRIHDVNACLCCHKHGSNSVSGSVVRMQMNRNTDFLLERSDQLRSSGWLEKSRHILDAEDVSPAFFEFFCHSYIVIKRVFGSGRIQNISGIAEARFRDHALIESFVKCNFHALNPVE